MRLYKGGTCSIKQGELCATCSGGVSRRVQVWRAKGSSLLHLLRTPYGSTRGLQMGYVALRRVGAIGSCTKRERAEFCSRLEVFIGTAWGPRGLL